MIKDQSIVKVQWIPIEKVVANNYNPNSVASLEMKLLYISVKADGYTQPVVTIYDKQNDKYVIVDGFHRYSIMKRFKDIYVSCEGELPCVISENSDEQNNLDRMADNKIAEFSEWDKDELAYELDMMTTDLDFLDFDLPTFEYETMDF